MEPTLNQTGASTQRTQAVPPAPNPDPLAQPVPESDTGGPEPENQDPGNEQEFNPLGSGSDQDQTNAQSIYSGLSYRSASDLSQLQLVSEVYSPKEIDEKIGEPFGPITIAVPSVSEDPEWFRDSIETRFDTDVDIETILIQQSPKGSHPSYEATIVLKMLTEKGAAHLRNSTVLLKRGLTCPIFVHPRRSASWTQGTMTVRISGPERAWIPQRDTLFEKVRFTIDEGLRNTLNDMWISEQGWEIRDSDKDYEATGMSPFTAYHHWKQGQRDNGTSLTEHSSHANWSIKEMGTVMSTHEDGRVKKEFKQRPLQDSIEIRYPIVLTSLIKAQIEYAIPTLMKVKVQVFEPLFPKTIARIMKEGYVSEENSKRAFLMRLVSLPANFECQKWSHPTQITDLLMDAGHTVASVHTEYTVLEMRDMPPQCVSVSKILFARGPKLSTSIPSLIKQIGGATITPWHEQNSSFTPRINSDVFPYGGEFHLVPLPTVPKRSISDSIMKAMEDAQQSARAASYYSFKSLWIDTSPQARDEGKAMAALLGSMYLPLPNAGANEVSQAIMQGLKKS